MKFETRFNLNDSVGFYPDGGTNFFNRGLKQGRIVGFKITEAGIFYLIIDSNTLKVVEVDEKDIPEAIVADSAQWLAQPHLVQKLIDEVKNGERSLS
jgi:hypothetical protein